MDYRYNRYNKKTTKKSQTGYKVIYNQLVICLVVIIVILFSRLIFNDENKSFDAMLSNKLSENVSLKDLNEKVVSVFSKNKVISDILNGDLQSVFKSSTEEEEVTDPTFEDNSEMEVLTYEKA